MSRRLKEYLEKFAKHVLTEEGFCDHKMEWTTGGDILIGKKILIDESAQTDYDWLAKERVLHEIAHIRTLQPKGSQHTEVFFDEYAMLVGKYMGTSRKTRKEDSERRNGMKDYIAGFLVCLAAFGLGVLVGWSIWSL